MLSYPSVSENLGKYINARFPILYINTFEDSKADKYIKSIADRRKVFEWNGANGFVDFHTKSPLIPERTLEATLKFLLNSGDLSYALLVIKDADIYFKSEQPQENKVVALLKEFGRKIWKGENEIDAAIIIISSSIHIPKPLEKMITVMELDYPDENEIRSMIYEFIEENSNIPTVHEKLIEELSSAFKGLTEFEIKDLLSLSVAQDGKLTRKNLSLIIDQKKQIIMKADILEMIPHKEKIEDIGGLENLKEWLDKKSKVFNNGKAKDFGVPVPKGVLIAGVPGCGKSLTAKAAGALFDVPLLKLDMGRLMGRYLGESEEKMRKAIRLAEAISPCVLWVDELEKAFAGVGGNGGHEVTNRLFGTFLTWMQDKTSPVFVVATANKLNLPHELLRKGRFDDIFYVSLPNSEERKSIFEIHIGKIRRLGKGNVGQIEIGELVAETEGYTGADIEGVVSESIENAFVKGTSLTTEILSECISGTRSLSEIRPKMIEIIEEEFSKYKPASKQGVKKDG